MRTNPMLNMTAEQRKEKSEKVLAFLKLHGYNYNRLANEIGMETSNLRKSLLMKPCEPYFYIKVAGAIGVSITTLFELLFPNEMEQYFKK